MCNAYLVHITVSHC